VAYDKKLLNPEGGLYKKQVIKEAEKALAKKKEVKKTLIERLNQTEFEVFEDEALNDVKYKKGYYNKDTGKTPKIAYINRYVAVKYLNEIFDFAWSFDIQHQEERVFNGNTSIVTIGTLTIDHKDLKRSVSDVGEHSTPKASSTDCLKRCVALILPMVNKLYDNE
jgi:hypothetical protein|tara:strand:- start:50 stop:544 length:495 start_codon:yes stop_codon:yes gene_type:complete